MSIQIVVNDEPVDIQADATIQRLLEQLAIGRRAVAVEVNGLIIPTAKFSETQLSPKDRLEIVALVGGG